MPIAESLRSILAAGTVIADRFEIVEAPLGTIGSAGFACLANDKITGERVVCKFPLSCAPAYVNLLRTQYSQLRRIRSPHVAHPYTLFEHQLGAETVPFMVLEQVEGLDLGTWASERTKRERMEALAQVCDGLASLHQVNLAHGDLHTGNVLVTRSHEVVLIDPDSDTLGSSSQRTTIPSREDQGTLQSLIFEIVPDIPLSLTVKQLTAKDPAQPSDVARALRGLIASEFLPGEISANLQQMAGRAREDAENRGRIYARLVQARELAIRALADRLAAAAQTLGLTAVEDFDNPPAMSADPTRGSLPARNLQYRTSDGDTLTITFEASLAFRRPWPFPETPGLVGKGAYSVIRDGVVVATDQLWVWCPQDVRTGATIAETPGRPLVEETYARWFAILIGETLPGLRQPVRTTGKRSLPISLSMMLQSEDLREVREAHPELWDEKDDADDDTDGEADGLGLEKLNRGFERTKKRLHATDREAVRQFLTGWKVGGIKPADLRTFFRTPAHARATLVQAVGAQLFNFVDGYVQEARRMDVRVKEPGTRTLEVVVELILRNEKQAVIWPFDIKCS